MANLDLLSHVPEGMRDEMGAAAEWQRQLAPHAIDALRTREVSSGVGDETRDQAIEILTNFANGQMADGERGYADVPMTSFFGEAALSRSDFRAITTWRLPILGSPNEFGTRPVRAENAPNLIAAFAINGLGREDMIDINTGSNGNHVAVISHSGEGVQGLFTREGRTLPYDGKGDTLTTDAVIVTDPANTKGLVGASADNPIIVGTVGGKPIFVNGGWNNLASGVDLAVKAKLEELGLSHARTMLAVGPGARRGFSVRESKIAELSQRRAEQGGDPNSYQHSLDLSTASESDEKINLELAAWAQMLMGNLALNDGVIEGMGVCTLAAGRAGYVHSSRVERKSKTKPGEMADGDRNGIMLVPIATQREYARI